jgi:predicted MPP superfamily phosphohydrolase
MIVSRGLGNSEFPQRIFNRPDVRLVILKKEQRKESNSK